MKKVVFFLLALLSASLIVSCSSDDEPSAESMVTDLTVSPSDTTVMAGESFQLNVTLTPEVEAKINYNSEDPSIASVNEHGIVSALKEGSVKIDVECGNVKKSCNLTVTKKVPKMKVDILELNSTSVTVKITPPSDEMRYICNIRVRESYDKIISRFGNVPAANRGWWEYASGEKPGGKKYRQMVEIESFQGTQTKHSSEYELTGGAYILPDNHEIVLTAYGIDQDGYETTEVLTMVLKTKPRVPAPSLKFDIKIVNNSEEAFKATIKPSDPNKQYYMDIQRKSYVDFFRNPSDDKKVIDNLPAEDYMVFELMNATISHVNNAYEIAFRHGNTEFGSDLFPNLKKNKDYVLMVWGWDNKEGRTTDVHYVDFNVLP